MARRVRSKARTCPGSTSSCAAAAAAAAAAGVSPKNAIGDTNRRSCFTCCRCCRSHRLCSASSAAPMACGFAAGHGAIISSVVCTLVEDSLLLLLLLLLRRRRLAGCKRRPTAPATIARGVESPTPCWFALDNVFTVPVMYVTAGEERPLTTWNSSTTTVSVPRSPLDRPPNEISPTGSLSVDRNVPPTQSEPWVALTATSRLAL